MNIQILTSKDNYKILPTVIANLMEMALVPFYPKGFLGSKGNDIPDVYFLYNPLGTPSYVREQVKDALANNFTVFVWQKDITLELLANKIHHGIDLINLNKNYMNIHQSLDELNKYRIKKAELNRTF